MEIAYPPYRSKRPSCRSSNSSLSSSSFSSIIPFSWEEQPGIPKHRELLNILPNLSLPPPPPVCSNTSLNNRKQQANKFFIDDPFVAAFTECTKKQYRPVVEIQTSNGYNREKKAPSSGTGQRRRVISGLSKLVIMYGSCKETCAVADSAIYIPRPSIRSGVYGFLTRHA